MAEYIKDKYSKLNGKSQSARQYVADRIAVSQKFDKMIENQSSRYIRGKELAQKDIMISKGILYAYFDFLGEGLDLCDFDYKNHPFFIKGYEIGNRRRKIEGMDAYINKVDLSLIPEDVKCHCKFIEGYLEAEKRDSRKDIKQK